MKVPNIFLKAFVLLSVTHTSTPKSKSHKTINKLIRTHNSRVIEATAAVSSLQGDLAALIKYSKDSSKSSYRTDYHLSLILGILKPWERPMVDMGDFSRNGDQSIVLDGSPGVRWKGHFHTNRMHITCPTYTGFCRMSSRRTKFDIHKSSTKHALPLSGGVYRSTDA